MNELQELIQELKDFEFEFELKGFYVILYYWTVKNNKLIPASKALRTYKTYNKLIEE
jgi:hypothetical protein